MSIINSLIETSAERSKNGDEDKVERQKRFDESKAKRLDEVMT